MISVESMMTKAWDAAVGWPDDRTPSKSSKGSENGQLFKCFSSYDVASSIALGPEV